MSTTTCRRVLRGVAEAVAGMAIAGAVVSLVVVTLVGLAYLVLLAELALSAFLVFGWPWWLPKLLSKKPNPEMVAQRQASLDHVRSMKASGHVQSREYHEQFERWLDETNDRLRL